MSFLTPPLPSSPPSPWKFNRRNRSAASQDLDRSSGSDFEHEDPPSALPSGIELDPGKKKIFGVSLSIAAPPPTLRKIKYKPDKKESSKDKITAKLLLNSRLSATIAAIEEEKKQDSIIADLSQQRASEIAQSIQEKRDKEEKWKYGRHRTYKKIWTPQPRAKVKRPRSSKSRSRSTSRGKVDKKSEQPKDRGPVFNDWASLKSASPSELEEYNRQRERQEKKLEKYASKGKLPRLVDEIKPVFDLTDTVIRPRSFYAFAREGEALVSYPLINVHYTEKEPSLKWSPHPKSEKAYYVPRKVFAVHADRVQMALFSAIADSRTRPVVYPPEHIRSERPWYPNDSFLESFSTGEPIEPTAAKYTKIIMESVDEQVAAAKKAIMDMKQAMFKKEEEEEPAPQMPPPFLSSFKPVLGSPGPVPEVPDNPQEPQQLVSEYEEFLKIVSDKDQTGQNRNFDWDSESDSEAPAAKIQETYNPIEQDVPEDSNPMAYLYIKSILFPPEEKTEKNESAPGMEYAADIKPVIKDFQLNVDTLGKEFQAIPELPAILPKTDSEKQSPKKKKKGKKSSKKTKKKYESSGSESDSSDSSSDSDEENNKKRKKRKKKVKKHKKSASTSESSSDSEADRKKKKTKPDKCDGEVDQLLFDLQVKKKVIAQRLDDLEHVSDKKTKKALTKSLQKTAQKLERLETLLLKQGKKKDGKRRRENNADSRSSDSDSADEKRKTKKKSKKKKAKRNESSSSESSDDEEGKNKKKKRSKKFKNKKEKRRSESVGKNNENIVDAEKPSRKRSADEDTAPITPKTMFMDFASSTWIEQARLNDTSVVSDGKQDTSSLALESCPEIKAPYPRSVRDVTNTLKSDDDQQKMSARKNDWEAGPSGSVMKGNVEFRAFQAVSVGQPAGKGTALASLPVPAQDVYSPGASESEASRSITSPLVTSAAALKPFRRTKLESVQMLGSDSQTSTSFFNVASAEKSSDRKPVNSFKKLGTTDYYPDDELVPPGMEPCILDKPPRQLTYSYETGGLLESTSEDGSDMSVDDDPAGRRIKSKIKSLKMQTKLKMKPSVFISPVKLLKESSLTDKDIPEDSSMSPGAQMKKQPKVPMTVESVFYQDSDSDEEETLPPPLDFSSIFTQGTLVTDSAIATKTEEISHVQLDEKKTDESEKHSQIEQKKEKRDRSKDRRKSPSPRRHRRSSRSLEKRSGRRSPDRRDSIRYSRSPDRRRRRSPSPKRRHRSPSPRRRRKDHRSRSRSRSYSPRGKRAKRRSRSRSPRRGESPRKRGSYNLEPMYHPEENSGRIPVLGTTIPAPMPGGLYAGEDMPPNGSSHRLSLDQRIELELGVKARNTPPTGERQSSCYYPPYNVSHYPYAPNTVVQVGNLMEVIPSTVTQHPVSTQQTNIVQVGNVLEVVPLARATAVVAPTPVAPEPPVVDACQNPLVKAIQAERERRKKEKEARKKEREERRKARQAKRDAKHMTIAEKLKLSNSLIADLIDMKAERNEGLVLGQDMEDEELLMEALDPPSPPGQMEIVADGNSSAAGKSILVTPGSIKEITPKKNVKFADGLLPGEGSDSEAEGAEKTVPKPKLPKEKRFKKKLKKKIKVQVVRHTTTEPVEVEEEDNLPPPSPPPGDPPPIMYASFPFGGQVQYPVFQIGSTGKTSLSTLK